MTKDYPLRHWLCKHSTFKDFKQGKVYEYKKDSSGCLRIFIDNPRISWAPYWQEHGKKFCYAKSELDFYYLWLPVKTKPLLMSITCDYQPTEVYVNNILYITGTKT